MGLIPPEKKTENKWQRLTLENGTTDRNARKRERGPGVRQRFPKKNCGILEGESRKDALFAGDDATGRTYIDSEKKTRRTTRYQAGLGTQEGGGTASEGGRLIVQNRHKK